MFFPLNKDKLLNDLSFRNPQESIQILPIKSTFKVAPWDQTLGLAFAQLKNLDNTNFMGCSRTILENASAALRNQGYELRVAIEMEFTVLKKGGIVLEDGMAEDSYNLNVNYLLEYQKDLSQIHRMMKEVGIKVRYIKKEIGFSQFEMMLDFEDALHAIDNYYRAKMIITQYFLDKGIKVTFLP